MRPNPRDDRGSVLLLGIGVVTICLLAIVVLVDASATFLQRQQLLALADAAALAGAQAIDLDAYYAGGASAATALDAGQVPVRVRTQLARSRAATTVAGLGIDRISSDGGQVLVALSAPLQLPFLSSVFDARVVAEGRAQLAYRGIG